MYKTKEDILLNIITINFAFTIDSPFVRKLTKMRQHYSTDSSGPPQTKESSPPCSAGCKSNILFMVLHGGMGGGNVSFVFNLNLFTPTDDLSPPITMDGRVHSVLKGLNLKCQSHKSINELYCP